MNSGRKIVVFLLMHTTPQSMACHSEISVPYEADANIYIQAVCEELCERYDECTPDPELHGECVFSECVDELAASLDDPCFIEKIEMSRCRLERETCDEYFDTQLETNPGSVCYDLVLIAFGCIERHSDGG